MFKTKLVEVGDSVGCALPQELLDSWQVKEGDTLYAVPTEGSFRLMRQPPGSEMSTEIGVLKKS